MENEAGLEQPMTNAGQKIKETEQLGSPLRNSSSIEFLTEKSSIKFVSLVFQCGTDGELPEYKVSAGTSFVAQWLRICLPMQGTRVRFLVWEDSTCCGATKPGCHNY